MIPLVDLGYEYQSIKEEIDQAVDGVLGSSWFILGPKVKEFEEKFAQYLGVKYAVGVASGTEALRLAFLALDIKAGEGIILPANAYPTAFAISAIGAIPQLVDIEPETFNLDPTKIKSVISKKTRAIVPVHLYGQPVDFAPILKLAKKHKLLVIEDCAQAHGAKYKMKKVGSFGELGCFSFYPTKNLGAYGDGGMLVTNNKNLARRVRMLRMYGEKKRYQSVIPGFNSRLDELQAAILLVKLKYLDLWNQKRRKAASYYQDLLARSKVILPQEQSFATHVWHLFVMRCSRRDNLQAYLKEKQIITGIHYPTAVHLQKSYQYLGYKKGDFPVAETISREILSLPLYPGITRKQQRQVVKEIINFYEKY